MGYQLSNQSGFTLIEEVMAIFVVSMLVICIMAIFPISAVSSKMNGNYAQAISLAQHKIDQMRAVGYGRLNYDDLNSSGIIDDSPTKNPYKFNQVDNLSDFLPSSNGTINITESNLLPGLNGVKQVEVTITWASVGSRQTGGTYTIDALIAKE